MKNINPLMKNQNIEVTDFPIIYFSYKNYKELITKIFELLNKNDLNMILKYLNDTKDFFDSTVILDKIIDKTSFQIFGEDVNIDKIKYEIDQLRILDGYYHTKEGGLINKKSLIDIKDQLKHLIKHYNNWITFAMEWDANLKIKVDDESVRKFLELLRSMKTYKKKFELPISEADVDNILILDINYFNNRIVELNLLIGAPISILNNLLILIKVFSKTDGTKDIENNLLDNYIKGDQKSVSTKIVAINEIIKILKEYKNKISILTSQMPNSVLNYLKNIGYPKYDISLLNSIFELIDNLKPTISTDITSISDILILVSYLLTNKTLELFKTIKNEELNVINKLGNSNLKLTINLDPNFDNYLKYTTIGKTDIDELSKQAASKELINKLAALMKLKKYILEKDAYEKAKGAIEESTKAFKSIDTLKLLDDKTEITERKKILTQFIEIIRELNNFNKAFFSDILEYTDFEKLGESGGPDDVKCILANEIYKVKYYSDLLDVLTKMNSSKTKNLQKELAALLKTRITRIKDLKKYVDNKFFENLEKNENKVSNQANLDNLDFSKDIKEGVNKAIGDVTKYINTMKDIAAIVKDFVITKELFK